MRTTRMPAILLLLWCLGSGTAYADATVFLGSTTTPNNRQTRGGSLGAGLLIVGAELEYADTPERPEEGSPALRTGMGSLYLQTPFALAGVQPYATTGVGVYRERLGSAQETNVLLGSGGGVKVSLFGPVRVRFDYRVLKLRGTPTNSLVHRYYVGLNLKF